MQTDLINDPGSGNEDSLFGSPPPSPPRGRSPVLALPSGKQNVGTIALPGSHKYSELPVNPLASSASPAFEQTRRPPAQCIHNQVHIPTYTPSISPTNSEPPTRAPSIARKQKSKEKAKRSTPRPIPPPIPLPDPDAPPPVNFLRNQQALLGTAGLVGGVNPATLSVQRHTRGSTSSNPIVVEDDLNPPPLGFKTRLPLPVDPALLPTPSNEQIVASLIKQKNIFPVLESILKLVAAGDSQNTASSMRSTFQRPSRSENEGPPGKKRKLGSVPAGAADWDVPYPFSEGEGPQAYRKNWERDRGKQLIAQLVGLIKNAALTAATKTYFQQQHVPQRHSQPTYGLPNPPEVLADHSNGNITQPSPHDAPTGTSSGCQTPTPFDQFVASLLTPQNPSPLSETHAAGSIFTEGADTPSEYPTPDFDQGLFDNWMSMINASTPLKEGSLLPFRDVNTFLPHNVTTSSATGSSSPLQPSQSFSAMDMDTLPAHNAVPDFAIDPALLAISIPQSQPFSSNSTVRVILPGSLPSPMPSTSSVTEPLTPDWDATFPEPEIFSADQGMQGSVVRNNFLPQVENWFAAEEPMAAANSISQLVNSSTFTNEAAKPASFTVQTLAYRQPPSPPLPSTLAVRPSATTTSTPPARSAASKPFAKEDILRRARERSRQLSAEIARAKVELWEATIEQGVLAQLVKDNV